MDEERGYRGSLSAGGQCGWFAGMTYFALAVTAPFGGKPIPDDCFGCGPVRNPLLEWAVLGGIVLAAAIAFGLAAGAIYDWLKGRRRAGPDGAVEPPGLAISTATMLLIFLGIWCGAILWR